MLAAPPEFELWAQNQLADQRDVNASPALSSNRLFLQMKRLLCGIGEQGLVERSVHD